jgi:deoxyadenosine/deoxycytidine kinase
MDIEAGNNNLIVGIEGNSGVGKTTLRMSLGEQSGIQTIPEYYNVLDELSLPVFPPENQMAVMDTHSLWITLEQRRERMRRSSDQIAIFDRSPLTLFAFEYAKKLQGLPYEVVNLAGNYAMFLDVGAIKEPQAYVFVDAPTEVILQRLNSRSRSPMSFLANAETITAINDLLWYFASNYLNQDRYICIDSNGTDLAENKARVLEFIRMLEITDERPFRQFLNDIIFSNSIFNK